MKWGSVEWKQLGAEIPKQLIGVFRRIAGACQEYRFISARLSDEEISREFLWSDDRIAGQFHACSG